MTKTPPPGPGRAVSIPRISSRRIASLIVARATPKRARSSSFVPSRWPGLSSPPVISCSSSRAIASPSETRGSSSGTCASLLQPSGHPFSVGRHAGATVPCVTSGHTGSLPRRRRRARPQICRSFSRPGAAVHRLEQGVGREPVARQLRRDPSAAEDEDPVAHPASSSRSVEVSSTTRPRGGGAADQRVHLGLGADVDAARRVVEQQDRWPGLEPLGEHDLLLVAARQRARARVDRRRADLQARRPARARAARRRRARITTARRRRARRRGPGRRCPTRACRA